MGILPGVIKSILENEDNGLRFERLCLDIYSEMEGVELVPTSMTWDLAADGRSISTLLKGRVVLCATLEKDIDNKAKSDIKRLAQTTQTKTIVYCTSKPLSELKCRSIETVIRDEYPSADTVHVFGQVQLITLVERHESIFRKHYAGEIDNLERSILRTPGTISKAEDWGLRLALLTHESDDAQALRKELTTRLILDRLSDGTLKTPAQLCASITTLLHLPRTISTNYVKELVAQLVIQDLVTIEDSAVRLTKSGTEKVNTVDEAAVTRLLEGRVAVRHAIQRLTGNKLTDNHFDQLWKVFQDGITDLFYSHGLAIVKMVRSALSEEEWKPEKEIVEFPLEAFADRVVDSTDESQLKQEIRQAVIDMFLERSSEAFNWLTQICGVYVMMCSLGFETLSSQQITKALSCYCLVPDSDIVLSLLCFGEDNHGDVEVILSAWEEIGGKLFMIQPVLEEVAYHAWISDYDYNAFGERLALLSDREARRLIDNAFVRSFRKEAGSLTDKKSWQLYIKQFKGNSEYDYSRIVEHLKDAHDFGWMAEDTEKTKDFARRITKFLIEKLCETHRCQPSELDFKTIDKTKRDVRLIAGLYNERQSGKLSAKSEIHCIVTSSRFLKQVDNAFRSELGEPEMILSLAALGFLLTLTPQVKMGFGTLRSILFDPYLATRLTPIQRFACRAIAASGQWNVPWSRRVTLQRMLRSTILQEAQRRGETPKHLTEKVLTAKETEFSAQIIADALDKMAISPKTQEEINQLRVELAKLKEEKNGEKREERRRNTTGIPIKPKDLKRIRSKKKRI